MNIKYLKNHSINLYFLFGICLFLVGSCQSPEPKSNKSATETESSSELEAKTKKKKEVQLPFITQDNVEKVLTKFGKENPETIVIIKTKLGNMKIRLYEETPLHRANFIQLVKRNFYNGTVFHRVVKGMIIQGGNLDKPIIKRKKKAIGKYMIPAELFPQQYYHKKGAIASPHHDENNPNKRSTSFEFYIVQGTPQQPSITQALGNQNKVQYLPAQVQTYATAGGLPHLDGLYTVFGEVIEGLDVIDKIADVRVDDSDDWPLEDIIIEMEVVEE